MDDLEMKRLKGMIITEVDVSGDKETLDIHFIGGVKARFQAYGDCCSRSWIEELTLPAGTMGAAILDYRNSEFVDAIGDDDGETKIYQSMIRTTAGDIVIEYRNSSNGYYGGSLEGPDIRLS